MYIYFPLPPLPLSFVAVVTIKVTVKHLFASYILIEPE